jgi:isoleucyl-tRNA synthetase
MNLVEIEKRIINFWKVCEIFEKSLRNNLKKKRFNWIEGPPYANNKPHMGHFLTRIYKDSILRFFTMIGYYVPRRAGWDTHGLPIEIETEKNLGIQNKKEIVDYGIEKFNEKCKELVMKFKDVWERMDERMGFWLDHKNAYITYDPFYMESAWWIFKEIYKKGLVSEELRVAPYCPRCETVLAQAELGMPDAYKDVKDPSVYVKFKIINPLINTDTTRINVDKDTQINADNIRDNPRKEYPHKAALDPRESAEEYFLVWTTTPWTLPGNLALAVNPEFDYHLYEINGEKIWTHQKLEDADLGGLNADLRGQPVKLLKTVKGKELVGMKYEPLFNPPPGFKPDRSPGYKTDIPGSYPGSLSGENPGNSSVYQVYPADFVKEDEGTGIVHIAPVYGEEDFELGRKYNLGLINYLDEKGRFMIDVDGIKTKGLFFKEADKPILENLKERNLIFSLGEYLHSYPHCWRCKTPLIYYATKYWLIKVSQVKDKIIENFKKTKWIPESTGNRFYEWIKEGRDWNLSRTRFWGIPLPVWRCDKCSQIEVIGSLKELASHFKANNNYYLMRHCVALLNQKNFLSSYPETTFNPLTRKGVLDAKQKAKSLKGKIDLIYASPILRAKQTAMIIADEIKVPLFIDERLREIDMGVLQNKPYEEFDKYIVDKVTGKRDLNKKIENGESLNEVKQRAINFILELEKIHRGKNILIVSHGGVLWMLEGEMKALSSEQIRNFEVKNYELGEIRKVDLMVVPRDDKGNINLHRPYVDNFVWQCKCGGWYKRIPEIADIWYDSGCAPFSSYHYPFENKKEIDQEIIFPSEFIIEGIDQTRGWFYTLLVISTLIKNKAPYKNVLSNGLVLDEKGIKMSKSLGNVVDPMEIMEKYGADVCRFYLFYLNEIGENKSFNEEEVKKIKNEFFDLLFNVLRFYKFYYEKPQNLKKITKSKENVLDLWFSARLKEVYQKYYLEMINLNLNKASRILTELLGDFSRWWLRRSRERFQNPKNKNELYLALINFENFFYQFLKMLAPLAPFTAEYLYQEIKNELRDRILVKESIHLENMGKPLRLSLKERILLEEMEKARDLASEVHRIRKEKGIKVRQPLKSLSLKTKLSPEVLEVLKDEVNVLEIKIDPKQTEEIVLDFEITPELKEIGILNDFIRFVQDLRQDAGLTPKEIVSLKIETNKMLMDILNKRIKDLEKRTKTIFTDYAYFKRIKTDKKLRKIIRVHPRSHPRLSAFKLIAEKEFNYENFGKVKIVLFR